MTIEQKREVIRRACIAANPEIVELKMGCDIERAGTGFIETLVSLEPGIQMHHTAWIIRNYNNVSYRYELTKNEIATWKIIGRPIRLADVLLATKEKRKQFLKAKSVDIFEEVEDWTDILDLAGVENELEYLWYHWKFTQDDLSLQVEPVINFLYEILK